MYTPCTLPLDQPLLRDVKTTNCTVLSTAPASAFLVDQQFLTHCRPMGIIDPSGRSRASQHPISFIELRSPWPAVGKESSGSIHFEITKEITKFCISGFTAQCAICIYGIYGACLKWMRPELSFSDRWLRGTKLWERDWSASRIVISGRTRFSGHAQRIRFVFSAIFVGRWKEDFRCRSRPRSHEKSRFLMPTNTGTASKDENGQWRIVSWSLSTQHLRSSMALFVSK